MLFLFRKGYDLVFNARAVPWARALDGSVEHGALIESFFQFMMNRQVGIGNVAASVTGVIHFFLQVAELPLLTVARLFCQFFEPDAPSINARRGTGFHSPYFKTMLPELFADAIGRRFAHTTALHFHLPHMHQAIDECSGRKDDFP